MEHESPSSLEATLETGLAELGLPLDSATALAELASLVSRWAERINLTAHRNPDAVARRLILDALALGRTLPGGVPSTLVDLGSGAGFPGLPLAIAWPGCRVTLIEARERKHHFQRTAIRTLGLSNARAIRGRAEGLEPTPHQVVVAQAMAEPTQVLGWMRRWVSANGWLVLAQSDPAPEIAAPPGIRRVTSARYQVPLGGPSRSLWIGQLDAQASTGPAPV